MGESSRGGLVFFCLFFLEGDRPQPVRNRAYTSGSPSGLVFNPPGLRIRTAVSIVLQPGDYVLQKAQCQVANETLTPQVRQIVYNKAGGQCECTMAACGHHRANTRCPNPLLPGN